VSLPRDVNGGGPHQYGRGGKIELLVTELVFDANQPVRQNWFRRCALLERSLLIEMETRAVRGLDPDF
jgi:hypothetical protein